jgi:AcrR family transcriptional regulator
VPQSRALSAAIVQRTACELFAAQGFRGTTMKDIAQKLGVTAAGLYNHVDSKQALLFTIMSEAMDRASLALDAALADVDDVSAQLRAATESLVLDFLHHSSETTVCNTEIRSLQGRDRATIIAKRDAYSARVRAIVDHGCAAGRFDTTDSRVASFAVLEMGNSAKAWFSQRGQLTAEEVAAMYGEFALRIVGDSGRRARRTAQRTPRASSKTGARLS